MYCARFGISTPNIFSTAIAYVDAVHHRRHVIQAIGEGNHLPVRVRFGHLFEAAVQITDLRVGIDDPLAIDRDLQPERSVHRRMLRTEIQNLRMRQAHRLRIFFRAFDDRQVDRLRAHRALARRKIFSQRMPFKLRMRQDAPQIGMSFELDPEHVESFALRPVRAFPDVDGGVDRGIFGRNRRLDPHAMLVRERQQVIDDVVSIFAVPTGSRPR